MDHLREGKHIYRGQFRSELQFLGTLYVFLDKLLLN